MGNCFFCVRILKSEGRQSGREGGCEVRESRTTRSREDEGSPHDRLEPAWVSHHLQASVFYDGSVLQEKQVPYVMKLNTP